MFKSLRRRFTAMNMLVISLLMLAGFVVVYLLTYTNAQREIVAELEMLLSASSGMFGAGPERDPALPPVPEPPANASGETPEGTEPPKFPPEEGLPGGARAGFVVRYSGSPDDGTLTYETEQPRFFYNVDDLDVAAMLAEALATGKRDGSLRIDDYVWTFRLGAAPAHGTGDTQKVAFLETSQTRAMLLNLVRIFVVVAVVLLAAIWLVSRWFARRSIAPIEAAYNGQRRFIQDASHELKTPVAVIKTNLELMSSHPEATVASQQDWMDNVRQETVHMEHLTSKLLALARTESDVPEAATRRFSLSDTVQSCVLPLEAVLYEKDLHFTPYVAGDLFIKGSPEDIERLIHILMENAIQYTPRGGLVSLDLQPARRKAVLTVTNTGGGISPEDLPHIFERFYRADPTRSRATGGTGLGLSIAEGIVHRHGGTIAVSSLPGTSTTFTVTLPTA
ncbi:HAMP domain-containing histidine kinase [Ruminococcaceae bacterium OttesenSCG-928-A11]|nr:HAMP domain-containing histidine kinase [Ruminococcaceae bacterium OttesenSCG-928-A11]